MTFKIAISTMNSDFFKNAIQIPSEYIVMNQYTDNPTHENLEHVFNFREKGLSKSRNHAIALCNCEICLISDDDIVYMESIERIIKDAFIKYTDADIITFQIETPEGEVFKEYATQPFWHTKKSLMRVASVEIAFRHQSIHTEGLKFDEHFGLGATFPTGEEIIFLTDALKKGLKILYMPIPIVIHPKESSGSNYHNIELVKAKGAMFYRIFGKLGYLVSIIYAYKKYKKSPYTLNQFRELMFKGIQHYKRIIK